jgi:hypothetical protein
MAAIAMAENLVDLPTPPFAHCRLLDARKFLLPDQLTDTCGSIADISIRIEPPAKVTIGQAAVIAPASAKAADSRLSVE